MSRQMKKTYFSALYSALCLGLAFVFASCGSEKKASVESFSKLGASDDIVLASGNFSEVVRNAGCAYGENGIALSSALENIIGKGASPREKKEFEQALKIRGVDLDNCFLKVALSNDAVLAFGLTDAEAFRQWMVEDMEIEAPSSEDGYDVYYLDKDVKIFANSSAAYLYFKRKGECNLAAFNALKDAAAASPLADWQVEALSHSGVCVALVKSKEFLDYYRVQLPAVSNDYCDIEAMRNGYVEFSANLKGMKCGIAMRFLNADGERIKLKKDLEPINLDIFKYIGKEDNLAMALSVPADIDWKEVMDAINEQTGGQLYRGSNRMVVNKIAEVLGNVDGTVFISAHPQSLMLMAAGPQYWHGAVGAQMKDGAAAAYINEIKSLASSFGISSTAEAGATVISLSPFKFYLKDINGMLVISTDPISPGSDTLLQKKYFEGQAFALEATMADGTKLPNDAALPFQPVMAISSDGEKLQLDVELIGEGEYLLDTLFTFIDEAFK